MTPLVVAHVSDLHLDGGERAAERAARGHGAGRPLLVAPGVVSTLRLPWEGGDPLDFDLPPAIAFHVLGRDRRLTTHYRVVP